MVAAAPVVWAAAAAPVVWAAAGSRELLAGEATAAQCRRAPVEHAVQRCSESWLQALAVVLAASGPCSTQWDLVTTRRYKRKSFQFSVCHPTCARRYQPGLVGQQRPTRQTGRSVCSVRAKAMWHAVQHCHFLLQAVQQAVQHWLLLPQAVRRWFWKPDLLDHDPLAAHPRRRAG